VPNTLGYMLTWTTYGTWLQDDVRGYVKKGVTYTGNPCLKFSNRKMQKQPAIRLDDVQRRVLRETIINKALELQHKVRALAVQSDHIHLVDVEKHNTNI